MYKGEAKADILLVGNSRGLSFFQPTIEEFTKKETFNISYSAMPMTLAEVFVNDYLDLYEKPEKVLIDVTICDRENNALVAGFNTYSPFSERVYNLVRDSTKSIAYGGKLSHIFRNNGEIFQRNIYYLNRSDEDWLLDREIGQRLKDDLVNVDAPSVKLRSEMVASLVRTVELLKKENIDVSLVVSPYYKPFAEKLTNLDDMIAQVEKATKMKVYDYSRSMEDPTDFGDYQHINIKGSRKYIALMQKDGILSPNPQMSESIKVPKEKVE